MTSAIRGDAAITQTLTALALALDGAGVPYAVIGGIAAIVRGIPRHTNDVNVAVMGGTTDAASLLERFRSVGIDARIPDAVEFADKNQVLLLVHRGTGTPLDVSLAWLPFEEEAIRMAESVSVESCTTRVVRPEHLLIYKAIAWRERDREDIRRLIERYDATLPWDRIRAVVTELAEAMELPDRTAELDALRRDTLAR